MDSSDDSIVGIDLGTTNSVVAAVIDGQPQVLAEDGEKILPSIVAVDSDDKLITGVMARNQLAAFPDRTIASIKRRMGTMEPVQLGEQSFTPPEISAMILRRLRDRAARALGKPVDRAVITVPAFFNENQRQATLEAGELAGLKVERIINEPTAATLVYHAGSQDRKQVLVYDFGGGTFDVSIVRMEQGVIEVLSSKGDTHLGGDDLDQALLEHVAQQFSEEHGIDLRETATSRYRLLQACERAKVALSTQESVELTEEFIGEKDGQPLNLVTTVSRETFEELIANLVERTISSVDEAIRDAGLTIHQLDDLVLVGGSTRIPLVERRLREEFLRSPSRSVDPDLAVALGAAVQAASLEGQSVGPVLVDVTGHTLGIEALEELSMFGARTVFSPIIHRNSPLPARFEKAYYAVHEDQEVAEIHVLQGEHTDVDRNRSIGRFNLNLKQAAHAGTKVVVCFDLTLNGTLRVSATQSATGSREELTINNALSQFQAEDRERVEQRLESMFEKSDELGHELSYASHLELGPELDESKSSPGSEAAQGLESQFPDAWKMLKRAEKLASTLEGEDAEELKDLSEQLRQAMQAEDLSAITRLSEELDDVLFYVG